MTGIYTLTFGRTAAVVLLDCLEFGMQSGDRAVEASQFPKILDQYAELFSRLTACWQRVLDLFSLDAEFWEVVDAGRYDALRDQVESLARAYGIVVINSLPRMNELRPHRREG
jgi:hypothetical protein